MISSSTKAKIPNQLTLLRVVLAAVFFAVLSCSTSQWALIVSLVVFVVAALTDALDGHLARKWQVESTFGRVVDPFADKVLVMGALVMLAGPGFVQFQASAEALGAEVLGAEALGADGQRVLVSGVYPWMVVVMLARELLVTAIRGVVEAAGHKFGANWFGKWKMILQSVVVPAILLILAIDPVPVGALAVTRDVLVWATLLATVFSGVPYVTGAMKVLKPVG